MKQLLLFLGLLPFLSKAQTYTYQPFPDSVAVWVDLYEQSGGDPLIPTYNYERNCDVIVMNGDTTMPDTAKWNKLWLHNSTDDWFTGAYMGCIKEDSLKKVWFWGSNTAHPFIIYDFSLSVGDTFVLAIPTDYNLAISAPLNLSAVVVKDTMYNAERTLQLKFDTVIEHHYGSTFPYPDLYIPANVFWTEGVGAASGLFYFTQPQSPLRTSMTIRKLAYFNGDSIDWSQYNCTDTSYYIYPGLYINYYPKINACISPNPGTNQLHIQHLEFSEELQMLVYSIDGKLIHTSTIIGQQHLTNTTTWQRGIYYIELRNNQARAVLKWVKE